MTNQIPEEDRKKPEDMAANFYPFILIEERGVLSLSEMEEENDIIEYKKMGFIEGYTLGLQSAEKRVKELEDGLRKVYDAIDSCIELTPEILTEIKQLLSK